MGRKFRRQALLLTLAMLLPLGQGLAQQPWPSRPIVAIVPFAAGSATDTVARVYAEQIGRAIGQNIVVENRVGANGMIGASAVARAEADGYTLLIGTNSTNAAATALYRNVPFDQEKDFSPISLLGSVSLLCAVPKSSPVTTLAELITLAKAKPEQVTYASASASQRVSTEMLANMAGVKFSMVPYRSSPGAMSDLIAGRIELFCADFAIMLPQVRAGEVRALAVTSRKRSPQLPEIPTVEEAGGYAGYELTAWFALLGPARLPAAIVVKLNEATRLAAAAPELRGRLAADFGLDIQPSSPEELAARVRSESAKWGKAVAEAGIEKQ